ncbi:MAG TPA: hypothetical protein VFW23_15660 [Tepidisphaeraceae bacterium]|nr:hypothetical protein [Tepidisphaeraceae bacterium]
MTEQIENWLSAFELETCLSSHVAAVVERLPGQVRDDLMNDPAFRMCDYEPGPGIVMHVPVSLPGPSGASRSVVLKRTLRHRPTSFVRWLIAHELAHAHLRHGGRWKGEDPEFAADALAAEWGFPKPY